MKYIITAALALTTITANAQTQAKNWTAKDCNNMSYTLFSELDNGKTIVFVWVMPCGSCVKGATAAYDAVQSFATSHPGKVDYYIADDLGDASCNDLNTWITSNSIGDLANMKVFSNAGNVIKESDFGGTGMPHVVVIGPDHTIYYNKKNSATNDKTGITSAINDAMTATSVKSVSQLKFSVSPNPTTSTVAINYAAPIQKVTVLSLTGQVLKEEVYTNGKSNPVIDLSSIDTGVCLLRISDVNGQSGIQTIVKK